MIQTGRNDDNEYINLRKRSFEYICLNRGLQKNTHARLCLFVALRHFHIFFQVMQGRYVHTYLLIE